MDGTNSNKEQSNDGMDFSNPSFSSEQDVKNIREAISKSRADQIGGRRGIEEENETVDSGKDSELGKKDGLADKNDDLDNKKDDNELEEKNKNEKAEEAKEEAKEAEAADGGKKNPLNGFANFKKKLLKMKIILIIAGILLGFLVFIGFIVFLIAIISALLGGSGEYGDYNEESSGTPHSTVVSVALREYNDWSAITDGSFCGPIKKYMSSCGAGEVVGEYCAGFVTYALKESGVYDSIGFKSSSTCYVDDFAQSNLTNATVHAADGSYIPNPGDIAIYGDYSHMELVEKVEGDTVYLIGGNTGDDRNFCNKGSILKKTHTLDYSGISYYISY